MASQTAEMALMLEIRWARNALAASFESSEDHVLVVMIQSTVGRPGERAREGRERDTYTS